MKPVTVAAAITSASNFSVIPCWACLLLAEMLYYHYPDWHEGDLSQLRSRLAGQDVLADRARSLGIGPFIQLGRGEELTGGREKDSILADVLEAIVAALYRDSGLTSARTLVDRLFKGLAAAPAELALARDSKSELQEYLSVQSLPHPEYRLVEETGPPHDRQFHFEILVGERVVGAGVGKSKKIAQQVAASKALSFYNSSEIRQP